MELGMRWRILAAQQSIRLFATALGSYGFCWGLVALSIILLNIIGVDFHEAESAMMIFGLFAFLVMFLWSFSSRQATRTGLLLGALGVGMISLTGFIQSLLIAGAS